MNYYFLKITISTTSGRSDKALSFIWQGEPAICTSRGLVLSAKDAACV